MKKINSENLWAFINNLGTDEKVKFNVFFDDNYITKIYWNGEYFEWEEGTFTSEAFFNPLYDFVEITEDNKLEDRFEFSLSNGIWTTKQASELIDNLSKLEKRLIDHINELEEKLDGK